MSNYNEDILNHYGISKESKTAPWGTLRSYITGAWNEYKTLVRNEMMYMIKADGVPQYNPRITNGVSFGTKPVKMFWNQSYDKDGVMSVVITGKHIQDKKFLTKNLVNMQPKETAAWIWKNTPKSLKK